MTSATRHVAAVAWAGGAHQGRASGNGRSCTRRKGDRVLFGKRSGTEVKIDGEELLIMKESDVLGIIEGKASLRAAA